MLESIQVEQDRSGVHHAPRQRAAFVTGMQMSLPDSERGAFLEEGEMTDSHFSTLSLRPLLEAKSSTLDIWWLQSDLLETRVRMSSAWQKAPR